MSRWAIAVVLVSYATLGVLAAPCTDLANDVTFIETYLATVYNFSNDLVKQAALSGGVQAVTGWSLVEKFRHHRLYSFPTRYATPFTYALVAVNDDGEVTLLEGSQGFNSMLREEQFSANNESELEELARTFLRTQRFSTHKTEHFDIGIQIVTSADDIPYPDGAAGDEQRNLVATKFQVWPPLLERLDGAYTYTVYGWSVVGGSLSKYVVTLEPTGIVDYKVDVLVQWIGRHDVGH